MTIDPRNRWRTLLIEGAWVAVQAPSGYELSMLERGVPMDALRQAEIAAWLADARRTALQLTPNDRRFLRAVGIEAWENAPA